MLVSACPGVSNAGSVQSFKVRQDGSQLTTQNGLFGVGFIRFAMGLG